jgi:transcriptional regulator with XRE-family HTH domain
MRLHIPLTERLHQLPQSLRKELSAARKRHHWSQAELGQRVGLPQSHISGIESGKIVPRFDTLLDIARTLEFDLLMIPRALVPAVQAMVRDYRSGSADNSEEQEERPLYATGGHSEV